MTEKLVHGVRHYRKWGYEVRDETHRGVSGDGPPVRFKTAYTPEGHHIGDPKTAWQLCARRGIAPQLAPKNNNCSPQRTCSIGFSEQEQKWYGWSHRAIFGFGKGAEAKEGDCVTTSGWTEEWLAEHPEDDISVPVGFKVETVEDAKRMAIAFAESVG